MTSIHYLQDAIRTALVENEDEQFLILFGKFNSIWVDGRKYNIKIIEEKEDN